MTIQREDLAAAAAAGLLQYRQVEPLLVFLLQRDVLAQRRALLAQAGETRRVSVGSLLFSLAVFAVISCGGVCAALVTAHAVTSGGTGALFFFSALYGLGAYILFAWIRKKRGWSVRMLPTLMMASLPLAVFALQQMTS